MAELEASLRRVIVVSESPQSRQPYSMMHRALYANIVGHETLYTFPHGCTVKHYNGRDFVVDHVTRLATPIQHLPALTVPHQPELIKRAYEYADGIERLQEVMGNLERRKAQATASLAGFQAKAEKNADAQAKEKEAATPLAVKHVVLSPAVGRLIRNTLQYYTSARELVGIVAQTLRAPTAASTRNLDAARLNQLKSLSPALHRVYTMWKSGAIRLLEAGQAQDPANPVLPIHVQFPELRKLLGLPEHKKSTDKNAAPSNAKAAVGEGVDVPPHANHDEDDEDDEDDLRASDEDEAVDVRDEEGSFEAPADDFIEDITVDTNKGTEEGEDEAPPLEDEKEEDDAAVNLPKEKGIGSKRPRSVSSSSSSTSSQSSADERDGLDDDPDFVDDFIPTVSKKLVRKEVVETIPTTATATAQAATSADFPTCSVEDDSLCDASSNISPRKPSPMRPQTASAPPVVEVDDDEMLATTVDVDGGDSSEASAHHALPSSPPPPPKSLYLPTCTQPLTCIHCSRCNALMPFNASSLMAHEARHTADDCGDAAASAVLTIEASPSSPAFEGPSFVSYRPIPKRHVGLEDSNLFSMHYSVVKGGCTVCRKDLALCEMESHGATQDHLDNVDE